jgi:hypothetical protein
MRQLRRVIPMTIHGESDRYNNMPLSEEYRLAALQWVDLDAAARILESTKSAIVAQWVSDYGDMPISRAEARVKSSDDYLRLVEDIENARTKANKAKVQCEYLKMRFSEEIGRDANARAERRL